MILTKFRELLRSVSAENFSTLTEPKNFRSEFSTMVFVVGINSILPAQLIFKCRLVKLMRFAMRAASCNHSFLFHFTLKGLLP